MVLQSVPTRKLGALSLRIISAVILAPLVLAAVWYGKPFIDFVVLVSGGILIWEWARLSGRGDLRLSGWLAIGSVIAALLLAAFKLYELAGWVLAAGAMGAAVLAQTSTERGLYTALGVIYLGAACIAFLWLREWPDIGRSLVIWLLAVVWVTDIGAYAFGRLIGGVKLAPRISPNKTWAGLVGGLLAAAVVGGALAGLLKIGSAASFLIAGALVGVVSQIGDLFESGIKRHFGVKDASGLIPGHGGLLDRADGLLAGTLAVSIYLWAN